MRNRLAYFLPMLDYLAALLRVFGLVMLVPVLVQVLCAGHPNGEVSPFSYVVPAAVALALAGCDNVQTPQGKVTYLYKDARWYRSASFEGAQQELKWDKARRGVGRGGVVPLPEGVGIRGWELRARG